MFIALAAISGIACLVCFIMVLVKMFQNENIGLGILGIFCGLWTFIWGWMNAITSFISGTPCRVSSAMAVIRLVAEGAQGPDPVAGFPLFKGPEQACNGVGNAQPAGSGHFFDTMRVHMFDKQ